MIKIFDEKAYIEIYIKQGFKNLHSWTRDAILYVRWLKLPYSDGGCGRELSKNECKEELIRICKKSIPLFNEMADYKKIKNIIDRAWANKEPLLQVKDISISHATLSWFKKQGLKKNEMKLLFTLYIGYLIKKNNLKIKDATWFGQMTDREFLRSNSNISSGFSIKKTLNIFRDLNLIDLRGEYFSIIFPQHEDFIACENNVTKLEILTGYDLYNIGDALCKFYENYRYCEECGRLINNATKNKKYCDDCAKIRKYRPQVTKIVTCDNCKKDFETSSKNNKATYLCEDCYKIHRRIKKTETMRKLRKK
jgi:hypothetical protein